MLIICLQRPNRFISTILSSSSGRIYSSLVIWTFFLGLGKWLSPEKTLAEQGVPETETLLLKKKFFFSDHNVDRNDPIQLTLLFVQSRDMIVSGKHPCTMDEGAQLAALQCQVQFGNHEPDKHKPGFIKYNYPCLHLQLIIPAD